MLTSFIDMILNINNRYIPLCCSKTNTSDSPPECLEANDLGIGVLSVEDNAPKDSDQDKNTD